MKVITYLEMRTRVAVRTYSVASVPSFLKNLQSKRQSDMLTFDDLISLRGKLADGKITILSYPPDEVHIFSEDTVR